MVPINFAGQISADYVALVMQLLALFSVNLITGIALYIFFSLRYSRAIQKRDKGVLQSMRSIAQETQLQTEEVLKMAQEKQRSIYQLTRYAEELLSEMKAVEERIYELVTSKTVTKKTKQKKTSSKKKLTKAASETSRTPRKAPSSSTSSQKKRASRKKASSRSSKKRTKQASPKDADAPSASTIPKDPQDPRLVPAPGFAIADVLDKAAQREERENTDPAFKADRILESLGQEQLELSPTPRDAKSAYDAGRLSSSSSLPNTSEQKKTAATPVVSSLLGSTGRFLRKLFGDTGELTREMQARMNTQPISDETLLQPTNDESTQSTMPDQTKAALFSEVLSETQTHALLPDFEAQTAPSPSPRYAPNTHPKQGWIQTPEPLFGNSDLSRREKVKILLENNVPYEEIEARTGASKAEIDLLSRLPAPKRPRRRKL